MNARRWLAAAGGILATLTLSACANRLRPTGEPRGRAVCASTTRMPATFIRPGDRAINLRWCGKPPFPEKGFWLPVRATVDDVLSGFPKLGYGLVLGDVVWVNGERDPGGWIHTMVQVRIVDSATVLGPGNEPYGRGAVPFTFEGGVVSIDGVVVRSPYHERAALVPARRYLFTYAQDFGIPNPWAGPVWAVDARGRIVGAVGGTRTRPWMRALIGQDAQSVVDRLAARGPAAR
jgi:hypothetical protein